MAIHVCGKCKKFLFDEQQVEAHVCDSSLMKKGTLAERKARVYKYYEAEFRKKRIELYERLFPIVSLFFMLLHMI